MVVVTVKAKRKKVILCIASVVVVFALLFGIRAATGAVRKEEAGGIQTAASTNAERVAFLAQFGWEVNAEASSVKEVTIPATFSSTYTEYNKIQLDQGMDLTAYAGCTCKIWTYEVENYPDQTGTVYATLIVYDGQVIGGDIASSALDGFMHGFTGRVPEKDPQSSADTGDAVEESGGAESNAGSSVESDAEESAATEEPGEEASSTIEEVQPEESEEIEAGAWPID